MDYWPFMTIVIIAALGAVVDGANFSDESVCPKKCVLCEKNDTSWEILGAVCEDVTISELAGPVKHVHIYDGAPDKIPNGILKDFLFFGIEDLTFLKIQNYGLKRIWGSPLIFNTHLEVLDLAENKIYNITEQSFWGPTGLRVLILSKNNISHIPNGTFSGLQSLTNLNLSYNHLESISSTLFEGLPKLIDLDLSHNEIDSLSKEVMENIQTIERLKLGYNQWRTVPPQLFTGLHHLNFLSLEGNNLSTISAKDFPGKSVSILNIANNNFSEVPTEALEKLSKYELVFNISGNHIKKLNDLGNITVDILDLSGNHMTDIDPGVFEHTTISTLDLHNNELTTLSKFMELYFRLMGAREVLLHENPWHCDCNLQWLADYLRYHYSRVDPICKTPSKYKGQMIRRLGRELQKDCSLTTTTTGAITVPMPSTDTTNPSKTVPVSTAKPTVSMNPSSRPINTLSVTNVFSSRTTQKSTPSIKNTTSSTVGNSSVSRKTTFPAGILTTTTDVTHSNTTLTNTNIPNTTAMNSLSNSSSSEIYPYAETTTPNTLGVHGSSSMPHSSTMKNVNTYSVETSFSTENPTTVEQTSHIFTTEDQMLGSTEKETVTSESSSAVKGETSTSEFLATSQEISKLPGYSLSTNNPLFTDLASGKITDSTSEVSGTDDHNLSSETHGDVTTESMLLGNLTTSDNLALNTGSSPMLEVSTTAYDMTTSKQSKEMTTESFLTQSESSGQVSSSEVNVTTSVYSQGTVVENTTTSAYQTPTNEELTKTSSQSSTDQTNMMSTNIDSFHTTINSNLNYSGNSGSTTENAANINLTQMTTESSVIHSISRETTSVSPTEIRTTFDTSTISKSSTDSFITSEATNNILLTTPTVVDTSSDTVTTTSSSELTSSTESTDSGFTSVPNSMRFTTEAATTTASSVEESTPMSQTTRELYTTSSYHTDTTTQGIALPSTSSGSANTSGENSTQQNTTSHGASWMNMTTVETYPTGISDVITDTTQADSLTDDQVNATTWNIIGTTPPTAESSSSSSDMFSSSVPVTMNSNPTGGVPLNFSGLDSNQTTNGYNTFPTTIDSNTTTKPVPNSTSDSSSAYFTANPLSFNTSTPSMATNFSSGTFTKETTENTGSRTTDSSTPYHTVPTTTEKTTTHTEETTTPTSTTRGTTNQVLSSHVLMTTMSMSTKSSSGKTPTSGPTRSASATTTTTTTNTVATTTDNSTNVAAAQSTASETAGTSIAAIVGPVLALLILSCLGFLIFAGIKRNLLNKITDKILCSSEEGFFMPIKQFDQAKPLFNRKIKNEYRVYVTENGDCT